MKTTLAALLLLLPLAGCAYDRESLPPAERSEFDRLQAAQVEAEATPGLEDDAAVEAEWERFESEVAKRQAGPFAGLLPYGLGAVALEVVGALGSRRKRKLYGSALKNIGSGQVAAAAGDALKAWGVQHSSPQSQPPQQ